MEKYEPRGLAILTEFRRRCESGEAKGLRVRAGASLRECERTAQVSRSAISRWENGKVRPHGAAALRYAALLSLLAGETADR